MRDPYLSVIADMECLDDADAGPSYYIEVRDGPKIRIDQSNLCDRILKWRDAHGDGAKPYDYKPYYRECVAAKYKERHGIELTDAKFKAI